MIHTRICDILGIDHPIALGGMPSAFNGPELVAAVSMAYLIKISIFDILPHQVRITNAK